MAVVATAGRFVDVFEQAIAQYGLILGESLKFRQTTPTPPVFSGRRGPPRLYLASF